MLIAHVLTMPKGGEHYFTCTDAVIEFLEECIPAHPGAFAAYFKVLDLMPATSKRKIPDELLRFTSENLEEIEKYYGSELPAKYRPSKILQPDKGLVGADGLPISMDTPPTLILG